MLILPASRAQAAFWRAGVSFVALVTRPKRPVAAATTSGRLNVAITEPPGPHRHKRLLPCTRSIVCLHTARGEAMWHPWSPRHLGYGTMQLTGRGVWGPPDDVDEAKFLLRTAYDLGVRVFDSAWYYGPGVTHQLIREALSPFSDDLVVVTKAGNSRGPNRSWVPALQPDQLREACETDLRLLALDSLPLTLLRWHPHASDDDIFLEALETLIDLQRAGDLQRIGLSNVTLRHLTLASSCANIAAVSNPFSINSQREPDVVDWCTTAGVPFLAYYPLLGGDVVRRPPLQWLAGELDLTPAQVALAWLTAQSPVVVPIPGTRDRQHLIDNIAAQQIQLPQEYLDKLDVHIGPTVPR